LKITKHATSTLIGTAMRQYKRDGLPSRGQRPSKVKGGGGEGFDFNSKLTSARRGMDFHLIVKTNGQKRRINTRGMRDKRERERKEGGKSN